MKKITLILFVMLIASFGVKAQVDVTIGTGTETVSNISYPAPYGNYWYGAKHQMIIPASEIFAAGGFPSDILAIGFDVATVQGTPLAGFEIKIGTTSQTSISNWESGLTSVFYSASYTESLGWNMHTFSQPFSWDGVSSIIIETCFNNTSYTNNAIVNQSLTSYSSCIDYHADMSGVCASTTSPSSYNMRPNIKISLAPAQGVDVGISEIIEPVSPLTPGLSNVRAVIRNYGADTVTSATLDWSVNGTAQTSYSWTGLLPQQSMDTAILGTFTFPIGINTVTAWTSMPNGVTDSNDFNDTASVDVITCNPFSGTYTVGGASADFPSLSMAAAALANCGITGPVTLNVLSGTHYEQATFNEIPGASLINPVTVQSSTGNASDVTIQHNATSSDNWTLKLNGADYITFQNLTFMAEDSTYARVVILENDADFVTIDQCVIISQPEARNGSNAAGIYSSGSTNNFNIITNNEIWNGYYGAYIYGASTPLAEGTVFENNTVKDFYYYGTYFRYHRAPIVSGNIVENHSSSGTVYGMYLYDCDDEIQVTKNEVNIDGSSGQYALRVYSCVATDSTMGLVANNEISVTGSSGSTTYGLYVYYSEYQKIYHNSVNITTGSSTSRAAYFYYGGNHYNMNNVYVNTAGGYAMYTNSGIMLISDYCNYYSTGSNLAYWAGAVSDLTAMQAASGLDANSVSVDPVFTAEDLLYPGSVSMDDLGSPVPEVSDDIVGVVRSTTTPDMGCYEYTPPQEDAGLISIDQPGTPLTPGTYPVWATFKNFGLSSMSSCNLNFSVNGGPVTTTLWTGNLAAGDTSNSNMISNFTFGYGTHELKVWTSDPNLNVDGNALNDTMILMVTVCDIMSGNFSIGDTNSGADYATINDAVSAMTSCGIGGNVTFSITAGVYNEQVSVPEIPGASQTNRVTFQSASGVASDVVIQYAPTSSTDNWVWMFNGADYVTVENVTMQVDTPYSSYSRVVVYDNEANYNVLTGNTLIGQDVTTTSTYYAVIYNENSIDEFNIISDNNIMKGSYGIRMYTPGSTTQEMGNIIEGNTITDFYYYGIYCYAQEGAIVSENTLMNSSSSNTTYGLYMYYSDGPIMVSKNKIMLNSSGSSYPLYVYYCDADPQARGLIANNWLIQDNPAGSTCYGIYIYNSTNQDFFYNSVRVATTYSTSRALYLNGSGTASMSFVNNIFSNYGYGHAVYLGNSSYLSGVDWMDYNDLYTNGTVLAYASAPYNTLSDWSTFSGTDSNSVSEDPLFLSSTYLLPSSPAMNDLGYPLTQVTDDIFGASRNISTPDIGAAEFTPPQNDMAVIEVHSPMMSACGLGQNEVISASIYNNGLVVQSGIQMTYSINGGGTFTTPEFVSSSMNPGDTLVFTFNQTADMSTYGMYDCIIAVTAPGDSMQLNDSLMFTVENIQALDSFPHTQNFETFIPGAPGTFMDNWIADPNSGFRWQVNTGSTGSTNTGASGDHTTGSGVYVYTEASSGSSGDVATLTSKCIDMSSMTAPELRFWYHMWGPDHNHFAVDALVGGVWQTDVFTINGQTHSSASDPWLEAVVPLVNYSSADKIRFRVLRGSSYGGDVCIDDVTIQEAPQFEAELIEFLGPDGGCDLGIDDVTVRVTNNGAVNIAGNLAVSYWINGASAPVTDTIATTIVPGDTLDYIFSTPIDLTVMSDSTFELLGYIYLANDSDPSNDTAWHTVSSSLSPPSPMVSNVTINAGNTATLTIVNPDSNNSYYWYDSLVGGNELAVSDTFITPVLNQTTVYYVSSKVGNAPPVMITDIDLGSTDAIEVQNMTNTVQDFTGWKVVASDNYTNINAVNANLQDLGVMQPNEARYWTDGSTNAWGSNLFWNPGAYPTFTGWAMIIDDLGQIVDAVFWAWPAADIQGFSATINGSTITVGNEWIGDGITTSVGTMVRLTYDANDATDWLESGTLTLGTPNTMGFVGGGSGNGCESVRVPDTVFVIQPVVVVNAGMDTSICLGDSLQMNLTATGGATPYTYAWSPAGSLNDPAIANPTASPITNTTYSVTVTDQNGDTGSDDIIVLVNPGPNVTLSNIPDICIYYAPYTLVEGSPAGGVYSGPGVSGGVFDPAVAGVGTHTISYAYTDPGTGCSGTATTTVLVDLCIGLEDMASGIGMSVHPNPTSGQVRVSLYSEESDINLSLMDVTGKVIREENLINTHGLMTHELDLSKLPQGVYYIRLQGADKSTAAKVVKH